MNPLLEAAVRNNAELCAAVLGAQGRESAFGPSLWTCPGDPLPFYPNIVTLLPGAQDEVHRRLTTLPAWSPGWGIKDSFADLELKSHGFDAVLAGTWLGLSPTETSGAAPEGWERVRTKEDWQEWIAAWSDGGPVPFSESLLEAEGMAFWAVRREGRIVSGCLTNQSGGVTGFSNAFSLEDEPGWWGRLVSGVQSAFPGRPLVCWEQDPETHGAWGRGFENLGPLKVWLKH